MNLFGRNVAGFAKVVVILVAVLLVSSGLCGMQLLLSRVAGSSGGFNPVMAILGIVSLLAILLSLAALVVVLPLWAVSALVDKSTKSPQAGDPQASVQSPADGSDDAKRDDKT